MRSPGGFCALLPLGLWQFPIGVNLIFELAPQGFSGGSGIRAASGMQL